MSQCLKAQGLVGNALRLVCCESGVYDDLVELFVLGIKIGEAIISGEMAVGDERLVHTEMFPRIDLPVPIRLKGRQGLFDPNDEIIITSAEQVFLLAGPGNIEIDGYYIENGSVIVNISNLNNGFWSPAIYARFENGQTRSAQVDTIRRREEGGCQARVRVALQANDLQECGLKIEIFSADRPGALGLIEYRRVDALSQSAQNARLEAELRSQYAVQAMRVAAVEQECRRMFAALDSRMEAFIEYVVALTMDRLAGPEKLASLAQTSHVDDTRVGNSGADLKAAVLKSEIVAEIDKEAFAHGDKAIANRHFISVNSDAFFQGWNHLERDSENRYFRWMRDAGSIRLPCSLTKLSCVVIRVGMFYGGKIPRLFATIDGVEAQAQCFPLDQGYDVRVFPVETGAQADGENAILTLMSDVWARPADNGDSDDKRVLSAMIRHAELFLVN